MAYKDILVHVAQDERSPARLDAAAGLAELVACGAPTRE